MKDTIETIKQQRELELEVIKLRLQSYNQQQVIVLSEQALKQKTEFIAMLSHEIRTPMNGIVTMTDLLKQTTLEEDQQHYVNILESSSDALMALVDNLLDISKLESGHMMIEKHPFDLINTIEDLVYALSPKAFKNNVEVILDIESDIPLFVIGDALKIRQVIMNLLQNAVKFTHEGEILVSLLLLSPVEDEQNLTVKISIRDTGIGMSEEQLTQLFENYVQVHHNNEHHQYGGTGLGLAITKSLVELMKGTVEVTSKKNVGSEFSVSIEFERYTDLPSIPFEKDVLKDVRILLIDNNTTSLELISMMLSDWGADVSLISEMNDVFFNTIQHEHFDVCLLDLDSIDMEAWEHHQEMLQDKPLFLLAPLGNKIEGEFRALFQTIITKPIRKLHLLNTILAKAKK